MKPKTIWNLIFIPVFLGFVIYSLLDTFVLSTSYSSVISENTSMFTNSSNSSSSSDSSSSSSLAASDDSSLSLSSDSLVNSYSSDSIQINLYETTYDNTKIYVADIVLASTQNLKTAFAQDTYGKNVTEKTSETAQRNNAILAINGDYYGAQETGIVIRNGVVYRESSSSKDVLAIYADGTMKVYEAGEKTAQQLADEGVWQAFSFGPGLLEDGQITVSQNDEVGKAMASNPRTAIGWVSANHFVFVAADGRTSASEGLSLYQLAQFMQSIGVEDAYNLDGGGSTTMVFQDEIINNPTTNGKIKERSVSDIVYIAE